MDVELAAMVVDVEQDLRGLGHRIDRVAGMMALQQREVGDGLDVEQIRAGQHEEIAEHLVAVPIRREVREKIEEVVPAGAFASDDVMDLGDQGLEPVFRAEHVHRDAWSRLHQRRVPRKAEVGQPMAACHRVRHVRPDKRDVVVDRRHAPHDVVAGD